ncbi:helix-turn-helix domain-containing protein [Williamsia deligens]|uniref:Helix-turn-helix domain-containing protein n=1 Tax=Williamsia deligens TaxID=321325 RepID=A0ABW3G9U7_9NOCA|nr:helix-turn-helix transcriptional regulator [Williamsia deligens]MCP2195686.1 Helix-turn-helix domain-containing protein [Williamsia deligens]
MKRTAAEVGAKVGLRRRALGLDVAELARTAGVDAKTIRSMEGGDRWPRDSTVAKIERALGWEPGSVEAVANGGEPVVRGSDDLDVGQSGVVVGDWRALEAEVDTRWDELVSLRPRISRLPAAAALYVSTVVDTILRELGEDPRYDVERMGNGGYRLRSHRPVATEPPADALTGELQSDYDLARRTAPGKSQGQLIREQHDREAESEGVDEPGSDDGA